MTTIANVLIEPITSEKTVAMAGKFTFKVNLNSTKGLVKKAVVEFYKIAMTDIGKVRMINLPGKEKIAARGKTAQRRAPFKKAIVT